MLKRSFRWVVVGLVVVLVAGLPTAPGSAADGALDVDASLSDFSVLGVEGVYLKKNATVVSGDVGVVEASTGPFLAGSEELTVGIGVSLVDGTLRVIGDSVQVKSGAGVGDVYANDLSGDGTVSGSVTSPIHLPLDVTLPPVPTVSPGTVDFDVPQNGSLSLDAGAYGLLKVRKGASVMLTGGVYEFSDWDLGDNVTLVASAPVEVRVAGRVATGKSSSIGPAAGSGLDASDV